MHLRDQLLEKFEANIFRRPLFYSYPNGLRFELSEGRTWIGQFLSAHRKALEVSKDVFAGRDQFLLCLRAYVAGNAFSIRRLLRQLRTVQIPIPPDRMLWSEPADLDDDDDEASDAEIVTLAFSVPTDLIQDVLWCALAMDLSISPRLDCATYLVNLEDGLVMFPYDDRGMDIVGPNAEALRELYVRHHSWLLPYELPHMEATYGAR